MLEIDVCVVGAGPGGAATAMKLHNLNIPCVLLDKATFPRDKICGDALSGKVVWSLNHLDPKYVEEFNTRTDVQIPCWGAEFVFPPKKVLEISIANNPTTSKISEDRAFGFISKRIHFDHFLIEKVRECDKIDFRENINIDDYERHPDKIILRDKKSGFELAAKLVIFANGAHCQFSKKESDHAVDPKHYCGSVRAYFTGVKELSPTNNIELHYLEDCGEGYLWIFPVGNGEANVGIGMRSTFISKHKLNLKKELMKYIHTHPRFKDRFTEAEVIGKLEGFGLPLGSKKHLFSGDRFMLVGDAASLIDPLTGEGIGNAMISGICAARQAIKCLEEDNYSAKFMKDYDKVINGKFRKELYISERLAKSMRRPWLVRLIANFAVGNPKFQELFAAMFTDIDLRNKLKNPLFYLGLIFKR